MRFEIPKRTVTCAGAVTLLAMALSPSAAVAANKASALSVESAHELVEQYLSDRATRVVTQASTTSSAQELTAIPTTETTKQRLRGTPESWTRFARTC
jgi:hypothetical protein